MIKLTREELANVLLDYHQKFHNFLYSLNAELLKLKTKFTKMESGIAISRNTDVKLVERFVVSKRKCWAHEQYSRREWLEVLGISELVCDKLLENKIDRVLSGIDVEFDRKNIESLSFCHCLKERNIRKRSSLKRKGAKKIKLDKKKRKNIDHRKIGLLSGTKIFIKESQCGYYKLLWSKY